MESLAHQSGNATILEAGARVRADAHKSRGEVTSEFPLQQGYNKEFFQAFNVERHWKEHNAALKWSREAAEKAPLIESRPIVFPNRFCNGSPMMMPVIKKSDGPDWDWDFDGGKIVPWTWESMVAHLDDPSIQCVFDGPDSKGGSQTSAVATSSGDQQPDQHQRTIVGCELAAKDDPDCKRHTNAKQAGVKWKGKANMAKWDFMLTRSDGTVCFLHPNWSNNKVEFYEGIKEGIPDGSDGNEGYFKRAAKKADRTLKFDKSKTPRGVQPAAVPLNPA